MKVLVWLMSAVNLWFGARCFLNAVGVLGTSKYSQGTTVTCAVLFLGLGGAGLYLSLSRPTQGLALLVSLGPWVLALVVMFITLVTSKQQ